jgi:hypothetical protein
MNKSPEQLEGEIEVSRQALASDLGALKDRATPRRLVNNAARTARERGRRMSSQLVRQAKSNPFPVAMIGSALAATLLLARRRSRRRAADS